MTGVTPWWLVIPVKRLATAKSRLRDGLPDGVDTARLMLRMATATVRAASACGSVVVVTDDAAVAGMACREGAVRVPDPPAPGLNPAVEHGAAVARRLAPDAMVAVLVADLASPDSTELRDALDLAARHERSFVPDAEGTGTVMLCARPGVPLRPRFGASSAAAHRASGATWLDGTFPHLRHDVDTVAELPDEMLWTGA